MGSPQYGLAPIHNRRSQDAPPPSSQDQRSPLNNNSNSLNLLASRQYQEWFTDLENSTRKSYAMLKFIYNFMIHFVEAGSLVWGLSLGFVEEHDAEEDEGWWGQSVATVAFYLITCALCVLISMDNKNRIVGSNHQPYTWRNIGLNCIMILKPVRYWKVFRAKRKILHVIMVQRNNRRQQNGVIQITEDGLKAIEEVREEELKDKLVERNETLFQSLPMTLFQLYFLFLNHQTFMLCRWIDVSRVVNIIMAVYHAAEAVSSYDEAMYEYQGVLHFLSFYKSSGAHPIRVYPTRMINYCSIALRVCNFFTMGSIFYTTAYFMNASMLLGLCFLFVIFIFTVIMLWLLPELEEKFSNGNFGAHTHVSKLVQRLVNIFCWSGTRVQKFSNFTVGCGRNNFHVPLQVLQIVVYLVATYTTSLLASSSHVQVLLHSIHSNDTIHSSPKNMSSADQLVQICGKEFAQWYNSTQWAVSVTNYLFPVYKTLDANMVGSFNQLFNFFHVNWLLQYVAVVAALVFGYADLLRREKDPYTVLGGGETHFREAYPIQIAFGFWRVFIERVLQGNQRLRNIRKLVVFTVLGETDFYKTVTICRILPKCCLTDMCYASDSKSRTCFRRGNTIQQAAWAYLTNVDFDDGEVEGGITKVFKQSHPLEKEFRAMWQEVRVSDMDDKKLFLVFLADFDKFMSITSSERIRKINSLMFGCGGGSGGPWWKFWKGGNRLTRY